MWSKVVTKCGQRCYKMWSKLLITQENTKHYDELNILKYNKKIKEKEKEKESLTKFSKFLKNRLGVHTR